MENFVSERNEKQPPRILEVIQHHVSLRKLGREWWALCPFHSEKTPSFAVNPGKELFYCHSCHAGGDVISFIQKIEGVDFKTAREHLGLETYRPSPAHLQIKNDARAIALWARTTSNKICTALRDISDQLRVCKMARAQSGANANIIQHQASLIRQWAILTDLDDDINDAKTVVGLWQQRGDIEQLVESLA
jgi:hypothetical protein